jgi:hypothetical protein
MIQVTQAGVVADRGAISGLCEQFNRQSFALLPRLLDPALLARVSEGLDRGTWDIRVHDGIGVEEISRSTAVALLLLLANDPEFLALIADITGCGPFTWFGGRIYRMIGGTDHHDSWHDDVGNGLVAMSLNLSPRGFRGGVFQMRERTSSHLLADYANTGLGDAILFRISADLKHRVTVVEPGEPKVAFAGWFDAGRPSFRHRLHEMDAAAAG